MNHQVKINDSFSIVLEAVKVEPKKTIGKSTPIDLVKVIFKGDNGQRNEYIAVDFMGKDSHHPSVVKPGKKYLVTMAYRGQMKEDKVYMSWQGILITEL